MYQPVRIPRIERLSIRGLQHRLTWWGEPTDTPVVLLHGFMDCGATWQFLVDCLPPSWTCVAPDWRGFGDTEWASGGYWFPDYFADLEALLAALVPRSPARVVAHSMGGNIAGMYAGVRPDRLAWLASLDAIGLPRAEAQEAPERYRRWLQELADPPKGTDYRSMAQLIGTLRSRNPRLTAERAEFIARAWASETPTADGGVRMRFDPRHRLVNPVLYRRDEAEACWGRMRSPMLLLRAGLSEFRDRLGADGDEECIRAHYRDLQIVNLPDVGHSMHHEDPRTVARHIVEFDRLHPSPAPPV
jgi:pimeloyl-ACP methyl ester carboxylesterase